VKIKQEIRDFLKDKLRLELSEEKTKITNINKDSVIFLGMRIKGTDRKYYESKNESKISTVVRKKDGKKYTKRAPHGKLKLYIPLDRIIKKLEEKRFVKNHRGVRYGP